MVNFQEFSDEKLKVMLENPMTVKRAKAEIERREGLKETVKKAPAKRTRKAATKKAEEVSVND